MKKLLSARPSRISCVYGPPDSLSRLSGEQKKILAERAALRQERGALAEKKGLCPAKSHGTFLA